MTNFQKGLLSNNELIFEEKSCNLTMQKHKSFKVLHILAIVTQVGKKFGEIFVQFSVKIIVNTVVIDVVSYEFKSINILRKRSAFLAYIHPLFSGSMWNVETGWCFDWWLV